MKRGQGFISAELAVLLDELGRDRNGRVACVVLVRSDSIDLLYPATMADETVDHVEDAILGLLLDQKANRRGGR